MPRTPLNRERAGTKDVTNCATTDNLLLSNVLWYDCTSTQLRLLSWAQLLVTFRGCKISYRLCVVVLAQHPLVGLKVDWERVKSLHSSILSDLLHFFFNSSACLRLTDSLVESYEQQIQQPKKVSDTNRIFLPLNQSDYREPPASLCCADSCSITALAARIFFLKTYICRRPPPGFII